MTKEEFLAASLPYGLMLETKEKYGEKELVDLYGYEFNEGLVHTSDREEDWWSYDCLNPIIRHLNTLTQECIQADYNEGKPFIPIVELAKFENLLEPISIDTLEDFSIVVRGCCAKDRFNHQWLMYSYRSGFSIWHKPHGESEHRPTLLENQLQLFQHLLRWHYWPNKPENEDVVYVTETFNPYK